LIAVKLGTCHSSGEGRGSNVISERVVEAEECVMAVIKLVEKAKGEGKES